MKGCFGLLIALILLVAVPPLGILVILLWVGFALMGGKKKKKKKRRELDDADAWERENDREYAKMEREAMKEEREREKAMHEIWRDEPPTEKQLRYIKDLGGDWRSVKNKSQAVKLIEKRKRQD